jgi:hypothetical protein
VNEGPWNEQLPAGTNNDSPGGPVNTGGVFGNGQMGPGVFSFDEAAPGAITTAAANAADAVAGLTDALSFGGTVYVRRWFAHAIGREDPRDRCSQAYLVGAVGSLAPSLGRVAYAGTLKALPLLVRTGAAGSLERALAASAARNTVKRAFRLGAGGDFRMYTSEEIVAKYGADAEKIMSKSTQSNGYLNALGGVLSTRTLMEIAGRPSYCN